jgi:hypothetical protein
MSFRASVNCFGKEMDVLHCSFELSRETDAKGKPSSGVYGGRITMEVESTADTSIVEAMVNSQFKPFEGVITYKKTDEDAKMKELSFKNAYLVFYREEIDVTGERPMYIRFTVSAEEITMGNATHENRWPKA